MRIPFPFDLGLRRALPKRLFPRALLIIIMPMIVLQAIVAWLFYERHWKSVSAHMAYGVAGEIVMIIEQIRRDPDPESREYIFNVAARSLGLRVQYFPGDTLDNPVTPTTYDESDFSLKDRMLARFLVQRLQRPFLIDTETEPRNFIVSVEMADGVLRMTTRDTRLYTLTLEVVIVGMLLTSVVALIIAILFLRNQVRPIRWLASAAEKFGKGQEAPDFRPSGAAEVRQAARNLLEMKNRLTRQIEQRSEMLAGVSHDLRAPLTRMKLQLAMLGESPEIEALRSDVADMQRMVDDYLAFARGQDQEPAEPLDLRDLIAAVGADMLRQGVGIETRVTGDMQMMGRPNALKRCLVNLLDNSRRFATSIVLQAERRANQILIRIDDNGPGIPANQRVEVFRPFRRLDNARGPDQSGAGLGLTIARDVVRRHGGDIRLLDAPGGGLRVEMRIPV
ncbi:sensor histidine kinase [Minwuia thermotolerans]|uniref:histidine kinase n=1 Tax=Minwuia thermotolerans TaxID=2056226 RepID=A0A2M9FZA1_9PROT|nr:ATP-binding protein [Minwuia thermotolerans]PJK28754.1 two-component sensor histidine kinase [Minwuia thermotolerans]